MIWWPQKGPVGEGMGGQSQMQLTSESVEGTALSFQAVDDIHSRDGLPLGVLGVGDCVTDHVLQEYLKHSTGLFVDETGDTLHTTTASKPTDGGLGDTLDVITQHLSVPLSTSLSESLASFASASHLV